jgi:hypothetical protein
VNCALVFSCVALTLPMSLSAIEPQIYQTYLWHADSLMQLLSLADSPPAFHSYLNEALDEAMVCSNWFLQLFNHSECCLGGYIYDGGRLLACVPPATALTNTQAHIQKTNIFKMLLLKTGHAPPSRSRRTC